MWKNYLSVILFSIFLSLLISCGSSTPDLPVFNPGNAATQDELKIDCLFPSQSIKKWNYSYKEVRSSNYYGTIIYEFDAPETWEVLPSDSPYVAIRQSGQGYLPVSKLIFKKTPDTLTFISLQYENDNNPIGFSGMLLYLPVQINLTWVANLPFEGHDYYVGMDHGGNKISTISEVVTTPLGTFKHCVRTDFTADTTTDFEDIPSASLACAITYWYAPDAGIVKTKSVLNITSTEDTTIDEKIEVNRVIESYE